MAGFFQAVADYFKGLPRDETVIVERFRDALKDCFLGERPAHLSYRATVHAAFQAFDEHNEKRAHGNKGESMCVCVYMCVCVCVCVTKRGGRG